MLASRPRAVVFNRTLVVCESKAHHQFTCLRLRRLLMQGQPLRLPDAACMCASARFLHEGLKCTLASRFRVFAPFTSVVRSAKSAIGRPHNAAASADKCTAPGSQVDSMRDDTLTVLPKRPYLAREKPTTPATARARHKPPRTQERHTEKHHRETRDKTLQRSRSACPRAGGCARRRSPVPRHRRAAAREPPTRPRAGRSPGPGLRARAHAAA